MQLIGFRVISVCIHSSLFLMLLDLTDSINLAKWTPNSGFILGCYPTRAYLNLETKIRLAQAFSQKGMHVLPSQLDDTQWSNTLKASWISLKSDDFVIRSYDGTWPNSRM